MKQGKKAQQSGSILENQIEAAFKSLEYLIMEYKDYKGKEAAFAGRNILVKHFPYESIYHPLKRKANSEFVVIKSNDTKIRIECKWQQKTGSIDEKYPSMYLNALECPEENIFFIIDGGGYRPGHKKWLDDAVKSRWLQKERNIHKNIEIFNISAFLQWINTELDNL